MNSTPIGSPGIRPPSSTHAAQSARSAAPTRDILAGDRFDPTPRPIFENGGVAGPVGSPTPDQAGLPASVNRAVFSDFNEFARVVAAHNGTLELQPGLSFRVFVPNQLALKGLDADSPFQATRLDNDPAPTHGLPGTWYQFTAKPDAAAFATDEMSFASEFSPAMVELPFTLRIAPWMRD